MVLDAFRGTIDPLLSIIAKRFVRVHPDLLSWSALLWAFLAGLLFYLSSPSSELQNYFLFGATLFVFLNGLFDAIDGKVAKIMKKASLRGDFLDHTIDRYADVLILGGISLSGWVRPSIGLLAIIGVLLTSYMGTQSQAVGKKRNYAGLLGRSDRLALLLIFPILQHITLRFAYTLPWNVSILEVMMIFFAVMGNFTALQRFYSTYRWFGKK